MNNTDQLLPDLPIELNWFIVFVEICPDRPKASVFFADAEQETEERVGGGFINFLLTATDIRTAIDRANCHVAEMGAQVIEVSKAFLAETWGDLPRDPDAEAAPDAGLAEGLTAIDLNHADVLHGTIYLYPEE